MVLQFRRHYKNTIRWGSADFELTSDTQHDSSISQQLKFCFTHQSKLYLCSFLSHYSSMRGTKTTIILTLATPSTSSFPKIGAHLDIHEVHACNQEDDTVIDTSSIWPCFFLRVFPPYQAQSLPSPNSELLLPRSNLEEVRSNHNEIYRYHFTRVILSMVRYHTPSYLSNFFILFIHMQ